MSRQLKLLDSSDSRLLGPMMWCDVLMCFPLCRRFVECPTQSLSTKVSPRLLNILLGAPIHHDGFVSSNVCFEKVYHLCQPLPCALPAHLSTSTEDIVNKNIGCLESKRQTCDRLVTCLILSPEKCASLARPCPGRPTRGGEAVRAANVSCVEDSWETAAAGVRSNTPAELLPSQKVNEKILLLLYI